MNLRQRLLLEIINMELKHFCAPPPPPAPCVGVIQL
jgi:hypothetical protein